MLNDALERDKEILLDGKSSKNSSAEIRIKTVPDPNAILDSEKVKDSPKISKRSFRFNANDGGCRIIHNPGMSSRKLGGDR